MQVQMVSDIQLVVEMDLKETFHDGVWEIKERNITKSLGLFHPIHLTA